MGKKEEEEQDEAHSHAKASTEAMDYLVAEVSETGLNASKFTIEIQGLKEISRRV